MSVASRAEQADEPRRTGLNRVPVGEQRGERNAGRGGAGGDALGVFQRHAGDGGAHGHQQIADQARFDRAVEHHENFFARRRLWPRRPQRGDPRRHGEGQIHGENGAGARHARYADAAVHFVDQALGDGEAETGAAMPPRRTLLRLLELGEDAVDGIGRHPRPGIAHGEAEHGLVALSRAAGSALQRQAHAAGFGELDGVAHQIHQDLADPHLVADHRLGQIRARPASRSPGPCRGPAAPAARSPLARRRRSRTAPA